MGVGDHLQGCAGIPSLIAMSNYTRLGAGLWDWQPWVSLDTVTRLFWLALYTSPEARRICPGLFHGSPTSMAEAARIPPGQALEALDVLLERDMVEYDAQRRVLRLCELPDAGEYPDNGFVIKGWWNKFRTVPSCHIRDAHVRTIRWIMERGASDKGVSVSAHHERMWAETFGAVTIPAPRRRGVRRVADSDTGTAAQPSLFPTSHSGSGDGVYPQVKSQAVDNSASLRQSNEINIRETVSRRSGEGEGVGVDLGSADRSNEPPDRTHTPPVLKLVPPYTLQEALAALTEGGRYNKLYDHPCHDDLVRAHERWVLARVALDDIRALGRGRGGDARWLANVDIIAEVDRIRREAEATEIRLAMLREFQIP